MMKYFLLIVSLLFTSISVFAEDAPMALDHALIHPRDMESVKRGAKFFAANCMVCHTLIYLRYNTVAEQAGITYDKMPINVKTWPNGVSPPDLSLEADVRGVDWIYTYLHSFYVDTSRPTGANNLLVPNTAMPGIISTYQGLQALATDTKASQKIVDHGFQWYDLLVLQSQGAMTPQQFDETITDVVNFLHYAAEPYQVEQNNLGYWVIGFLLILFVLIFLLKKEYWKDIKK